MKTSSPSGDSCRAAQGGRGPRGDEQHQQQPAEQFAHRAGEGGEPLGPHHGAAVAFRLLPEPRGLPLLCPGRADQLHRGEPLGDGRGHLARLLRPGAGVAPQPPQQHPDADQQQRCRPEREQREPEGELGQHQQGREDEHRVLEERRQAGAHRPLGLVGILHHPRDHLSAAGALQPVEVDAEEMLEQRGAEIPHQPLLDPHAEHPGEVGQRVLQQQSAPQTGHQPHGDRAGESPCSSGASSWSTRRSIAAAVDQAAGRAEEVAEQRDEEEEGGAVQHRRNRGGRDAEQQPGPGRAAARRGAGPRCRRPRDPLQPPRLAVSSAIGSTISSGVTPPWRKAPRYRAWYSRSLVG